MARPKRAKTTKEQIEQAEEFVIKTKAAYDEAVNGAMRRSWNSSRAIRRMSKNNIGKLLLKPL